MPELDEKLTKTRMLQEVKSMDRARKRGVQTPTVYLVDETERKIYMEYLGQESLTLREFFSGLGDWSHPAVKEVMLMVA